MIRTMTFLSGLGVGAGLTYLFDPVSGNRRRALLRDKALSKLRSSEHTIGATSHDLQNRVQGIWHDVQILLREGRVPPRLLDGLMALQVRARLMAASSHPRQIHVRVQDGRVILSGAVLQQELEDVVSAAASAPSVTAVTNHLRVFDRPEDLPSEPSLLGLLPSPQTPEGRRVLEGLGGVLLLYGLVRRGIMGTAMAALGARILSNALGQAQVETAQTAQGQTGQTQTAQAGQTAGGPQAGGPQAGAPPAHQQRPPQPEQRTVPSGTERAPQRPRPSAETGSAGGRSSEPGRRGQSAEAAASMGGRGQESEQRSAPGSPQTKPNE